MGDVTDEAAILRVGFGTDGWICVSDNWERNVVVYVSAYWEVFRAWLYVLDARWHSVQTDGVYEDLCIMVGDGVAASRWSTIGTVEGEGLGWCGLGVDVQDGLRLLAVVRGGALGVHLF